jgi:16S rRNA pseudouridine516 synthase
VKLDRLLQLQGFGSRRECRARVLAGRVTLGGECCDDPDHEVADPAQCVFAVDGESWRYRERVYLALNKPAGYECSHRPQFHPSVFSLLPRALLLRGVQAVGRLDEDTTGLLLLSDDGQFIHAYSSGKRQVAKVYDVTAKHPVSDEQIGALLAGVVLRDEPVTIAAAACSRLDERRLRLTVTEGKYHLVKRMVAAAGNRVEALHRVAVGEFVLPPTLAPGEWCWLDPLAGGPEAAP